VALAWLAILLVPLFLCTRWLSQHLQGVGLIFSGSEETAMLLHYLVLLPGIVLHEVSHLVAATLVGVKTRSLSLRPKARRNGAVRFGAVSVAKSDPFRESFIGLAPLLTGTAAILLLARWQFGLVLRPAAAGIEALPALSLGAVLQILRSALQAPDALLGLYLIFAIGNAMWPSESDRQPWAVVLLFLALTSGAVYVTGLLPAIPAGLEQWAVTAATYLALAFALAISVDIPFAVFLLVVEKIGERVVGRHVQY